MSGHNKQKKTFRLLLGDVKYTGVRSNCKEIVVPVPLQTSSAELYTADRAVIIEQLQKEKEVITDLLDRFTNNADRTG